MSRVILFNADDWGLSRRIHDSITATLALRGHSVASALADLIQGRPMP